jgi:hypothetical protein
MLAKKERMAAEIDAAMHRSAEVIEMQNFDGPDLNLMLKDIEDLRE